MKMQAELTIAKVNAGDGNNFVRIDLQDKGKLLSRAEMPLEAFARALMGEGRVYVIFTDERNR